MLATGYELARGGAGRGARDPFDLGDRDAAAAAGDLAARGADLGGVGPYLYLRPTADGRVVCGGEDEEFTDEDARDALLPAKAAAIARKLAALMPGVDPAPAFAWTGSFGSTATGLPIIRGCRGGRASTR